ncbi:hypothetical protein [Oscillatoria nigro-viridis]|nr:hypothetical protein [Oscillatoria nigro-viridis]
MSRKLAIEMTIAVAAIGYSIRTQQRDSKQSVCKRIISLFPEYS